MIADSLAKMRSQDPVGYLLEVVRRFGFERLFSRYYGIYRAIVIDNTDEQRRGRCRVLVPALGHQDPSDVPTDIYALPCSTGLSVGDSGQPHGCFFPPNVGDQVFVCFERGIATNPIYLGGWWHDDAGDAAPNLRRSTPTVRGIRTAYGHELLFDDGGDVTLVVGNGNGGQTGSKLLLSSGKVVVSDAGGADVTMEGGKITATAASGSTLSIADNTVSIATPNGGARVVADGNNLSIHANNSIDLTAATITLKAPTVNLGSGPQYEAAVMGDTLARQFVLHTHISAAPGSPTTPQTGQFPVITNGLSRGVRVSL